MRQLQGGGLRDPRDAVDPVLVRQFVPLESQDLLELADGSGPLARPGRSR
ncbi:hypothetical protein [Streptomyces sp. C]|nr:hypothetical protein [Streptomyces sp. C]